MTASVFFAVAAGGLVGAPSRYLLDRAINGRVESDLPWGTFVINIIGSFVLGFLTGITLNRHLSPFAKALLGTGFCSTFTTFSTFTFETLRLLEDGRLLEATANAGVSVLVGVAGAAAGLALGLLV
jgi:fluoride exporter